jgi:hypothetical protein
MSSLTGLKMEEIKINIIKMEDKIREILFKPIKPKRSTDIILHDLTYELQKQAYTLRILQMRIGHIWELCAVECGWIKVEKINLINTKTKQAIELKNSDITDNSSSKARNYQKLFEFKKHNPDYEIIYACINSSKVNSACENIYVYQNQNNKIRYVTGDECINLLYGERSNEVIDLVKRLVKEFINATPSNCSGNSLESLTTTLLEKFSKGTQVMTEPKGNNVKELDNPQVSL